MADVLKALRPPSPAFSVTSMKSAAAVVLEEAVLPDRGDQQVGKAVVVVVADGHAHAVHFHRQAGALGDVGEGAVAVVAVEPHGGALAAMAGPVHAVDQQNIQPAIGIVIEEGAARAHGFRQILGAECAAVVAELDAGGGGDVGQAEVQAGRIGGQRPRREAPPRNAPPRNVRRFTRCSPDPGESHRPPVRRCCVCPGSA